MNKTIKDNMEEVKSFLPDDVERTYIKTCSKCGEKIYRYTNGKDIDFITNCECERLEEQHDHSVKLTDNLTGINKIKRNKELCGFSKRDIDELCSIKYKTNSANIQAYNELLKYGNSFNQETSKGYYIYGTTGTGKSLLMKKVVTIVLNKGYSALFITSVELLANIRKRIQEPNLKDLKAYAISVDLLVLDDFGVEKGTEWETEELLQILENRWRESRPILFTSNLSIDQIQNKYDKFGRIYSRILGNSNKVFAINGPDHRVEEFKKRNKKG